MSDQTPPTGAAEVPAATGASETSATPETTDAATNGANDTNDTSEATGSTVAGGASEVHEYETTYHRYEPHRTGLPNLRDYFSEAWRRREFAFESSKASMRGANSMTFFGQAWLIINPLLLAVVYYFLVVVIRGAQSGHFKFDAQYFSHLTGGLFAFYFLQGSITTGAGSVTGAGKLLLNTAFPRILLPLASVRTGFFRFLPTVPVYFIFHIIAGNPWNLNTLIVAPFFLFLLACFSSGLAAFFAAAQVYFRDTSSFLPYLMRIWLYVSPVLWLIKDIQGHQVLSLMHKIALLNPLYSILGGYGQALQEGLTPLPMIFAFAIGWSIVSVVVGFWFFIARERDFSVRL